MPNQVDTLKDQAAKAQAEYQAAAEAARQAEAAAEVAQAQQQQAYRHALEVEAENYLDPDYLTDLRSAPLGSTLPYVAVTKRTTNQIRDLHAQIVPDIAEAIEQGKSPYPVWITYAAKIKELRALDAYYLAVIRDNIEAETVDLWEDGGGHREKPAHYQGLLRAFSKHGANSPEMKAARAQAKTLIDNHGGDSAGLWDTPERSEAYAARLAQYTRTEGAFAALSPSYLEPLSFIDCQTRALEQLAKKQNKAAEVIQRAEQKANTQASKGQSIKPKRLTHSKTAKQKR